MRKPLVALGLALSAGLGAIPAADVLAAPTASSPLGTSPTTKYVTKSSPAPAVLPAARVSNAVSGAQIVQTALKYLGYPYTATGNSPSTGFSCIGFASFVYRSNGIPLPGDLQDAMAYAPSVPFSALEPGDLLYFQNTVWNGLSHVAIYIGGGRFVHAEYYGYGVRISSFNNDSRDGNYWIQKYLGANRPWGGAAVAPVISTPANPGGNTTPGATVNTTVPVAGGHPGVVNVTSLNVRSGPTKGSSVVTTLPQGASVSIIGKSNGWDHVQLPDGTTGWVMGSYVGSSTAASPATTTTTNPNIGNPTAPTRSTAPVQTKVAHHGTTTSRVAGLRVHSAPGLGAPVVTSIAKGERVTVLARRNGWVEIRTSSGQVGWIKGSYTSSAAPSVGTSGPSYNSVSYSRPKAAPRRTVARKTSRSTFVGTHVVTAGVRIHSRASLRSPVIGGAAAGTHVQVLGFKNGFALVRLATGQTGYVYGAYVR